MSEQTISKKSKKSKKSTVKPVKIPMPAQFIRRPHPKTGRLPRIKAFGFALSPGQLETWAADLNIMQNETELNQRFGALCLIMEELPDSFRWGVVRPHSGDLIQTCIVIGTNESNQDMVNAYNPRRVTLVRDVLGPKAGEPKWYYLREDFEYDK